MNLNPTVSLDDLSEADRVKWLRLIADHGLTWKVGDCDPSVVDSTGGMWMIDASTLGLMVRAGLLSARLIGVETPLISVEYTLTQAGVSWLIDSFHALQRSGHKQDA